MKKKIIIVLLITILITSTIVVFQTKKVNATGNISGDWWNNNWNYRKLIKINSSQVESTFTNFPVLINLESDSDLVAHAQSDGDDIAFVLDSDNTQLNHEIETFNGITGQLVCWVNITSLSDTVDTMIWMYYGNNICSSQQNIEDTWCSDYRAVWHFSETSGFYMDSTSNNNDGTLTDADSDSVRGAQGIVAGCIDFAGDADYISKYSYNGIDIEAKTYVIWLKPDVTTDGTRIFTKDNLGTYDSGMVIYSNDILYDEDSVLPSYYGTDTISTSYFRMYTVSAPTTEHNVNIYYNKTKQTINSANYFIGTVNSPTGFTIGASQTHATKYFNGKIDEFRIIAGEKSWECINTTYNTIANPSTFVSIGSEEEKPQKIIVSDPYPADGAIGVELNPIMSINVNHLSGNQMNIIWKWNNSGSWNVFGTNYNVFNGTYTQINMNFSSYLTTYEWRVEVNDGMGNLISKTYGFTTRPKNYLPVLSNPSPSNGSTAVVAGNVVLSISVSDGDSDLMSIAFMTNASGSWQTIGTNVSVPDGSYQQIYNFLDYNKVYWWSVNASDGHGWTNEIYSFKTIKEDSEPPKVNITSPELGFIYIYVLVVQLRLHILPTTSTLIIGKTDIKVDATDNKGINWVKFYINDELRATVSEPPYIYDWNELTIYDLYKIKVVASDLSGNQKSDEVEVYKIQFFEIGL